MIKYMEITLIWGRESKNYHLTWYTYFTFALVFSLFPSTDDETTVAPCTLTFSCWLFALEDSLVIIAPVLEFTDFTAAPFFVIAAL